MVLLQLTAPSITDIIQTFFVFITGVIAWNSFVQGEKISTLTDVVTELKKQNETLEKRFQIEQKITLTDRIPYFVFTEKQVKDRQVNLWFRNVGIDATDISYTSGKYSHYEAVLEQHNVPHHNLLNIRIMMHQEQIENIEFFITSQNIHGIPIQQRIHKFPGYDFKIDPPQDPL